MKYGTFPEIVLGDMNDDIKLELLQSYFESIVQKDCIVYNQIRDIPSFYRTANYVFTTVGSRTTPQQLAKACGSNENTVANYLNYLQDSHVCTQIRNFSYSQKETKRSLRKCYPCDNGIMLANAIRFSADNGSFFENAVFNELVKSGYHDISFYDGKNECDFIAVKDAKFHAFQATFELNAANIGRESAGLDIRDINLASKTILTANQKSEYGNVRVFHQLFHDVVGTGIRPVRLRKCVFITITGVYIINHTPRIINFCFSKPVAVIPSLYCF